MAAKNKRIFAPLMKVDVENRLLYGSITTETEDRMGESMDYDTSKAYFEEWSGAIAKASGGKSVGNMRVMHGLKVAGIATEIHFNDEDKTIDVVAKVLDDQEWELVLAGAYTGFSIGGRYVKKFQVGNLKKFTVAPFEFSLVDLPCVPDATFEVVKADGVEQVAFKTWEPDNTEITTKATELATERGGAWNMYIVEAREALLKAHQGEEEDDTDAAEDETDEEAAEDDASKTADTSEEDDAAAKTENADEDDAAAKAAADAEAEAAKAAVVEDPADDADTKPVAEVSDARKALVQVWKATDGSTFDTVALAVAHQERVLLAGVTDPLNKSLADLKKSIAGDPATVEPSPIAEQLEQLDLWKGHLAKAHELWDETCVAKSLYAVGRLAEMMDGFSCIIRSQLWERAEELAAGTEMGDGSVINDIYSALTIMGGALVKMAQEEIAEMMAELTVRGVPISAELPQEMIALAVSDQLAKAMGKTDIPVRKALSLDSTLDLLKGLGLKLLDEEEVTVLKTENTSLRKTIEDTTTAVNSMKADIDAIKSMAVPSKALGTNLVSKEQDMAGSDATKTVATATLQEFVDNATPEELALTMIKLAQKTPQRVGLRRPS